MKRYMVFFGRIYYPDGGMSDFIGDADTLEDAIALLKSQDKYGSPDWNNPESFGAHHWAHIYDTNTREIVFEN